MTMAADAGRRSGGTEPQNQPRLRRGLGKNIEATLSESLKGLFLRWRSRLQHPAIKQPESGFPCRIRCRRRRRISLEAGALNLPQQPKLPALAHAHDQERVLGGVADQEWY